MRLQGGTVGSSEGALSAQPLMVTLPLPQDSAVASLLGCPKLGDAGFSKADRRFQWGSVVHKEWKIQTLNILGII